MSEDLLKLLSRCKCGVFITVNEHRDYYEPADQYLRDKEDDDDKLEIEPDVRREMIAKNQIVEIHFYPDTPIGSYKVWHHDIESALAECVAILARDDEPPAMSVEAQSPKKQPSGDLSPPNPRSGRAL